MRQIAQEYKELMALSALIYLTAEASIGRMTATCQLQKLSGDNPKHVTAVMGTAAGGWSQQMTPQQLSGSQYKAEIPRSDKYVYNRNILEIKCIENKKIE